MPLFLSRLREDIAGNTLALMAAALIPLTIMVGSALDLSIAYMARAKLQNACDAGVLAGRQIMEGNVWSDAVEAEAHKFFDFNFPDGVHGSYDVNFDIAQNADDDSEILASAQATVPTALMNVFGYDSLDIDVTCDATRDLGHNDIVLVLDVTTSMRQPPSGGGSASRIENLRDGADGLYRALADDNGSITRYGIVPYSHTVNIGGLLQNKDILVNQPMISATRTCGAWSCGPWTYGTKTVHINNSSWKSHGTDTQANIQQFRTSGAACLEERPSVGNSLSPYRIEDEVTLADINTVGDSAGSNPALQFGRYDPQSHDLSGSRTAAFGNPGAYNYPIGSKSVYAVCISKASNLQTYADVAAFNNAISAATATVLGYTYHDVGMLWGTRMISRNGFFASSNPEKWGDIPINKHIVFMTDGEPFPNPDAYSLHGVESIQDRTKGSGTQGDQHLSRFESVCQVARSMGVTVWVIAFDVTDSDTVAPCATSPSHFYTSDGSDLEEVFEAIGQGIGNLRLTR